MHLYDIQTIRVMECSLASDSNCIDVGCLEGFFLREMLSFAPAGTHWGFEPLPDHYQKLLEAYPYSNLRIWNMALSDTAGISPFYHVVNLAGFSSLMRPEYDLLREKVIEEISVRIDLLDNVVPKDLLIRFMKIDVEGAELKVLRGAVKTIRRSKPIIVFEHYPPFARVHGANSGEVFDFITTQCGLSVSLMRDWMRGSGQLGHADFMTEINRNSMFMAHPQELTAVGAAASSNLARWL